MYTCGWMDGVMIALGAVVMATGVATTPSAAAQTHTCLARVPDWCPTLCAHIHTNKGLQILAFLYSPRLQSAYMYVVKSGVSFNYGEQV